MLYCSLSCTMLFKLPSCCVYLVLLKNQILSVIDLINNFDINVTDPNASAFHSLLLYHIIY